jgi:carbon-monoxide dehydrogenase medium subunit
VIAADDFFRGFLETALAPDEIITEVRVPKTNGAGWAFEKFNRRAQDWAIVGVAAVGGDEPGVALVNMGDRPVRAGAVEAALRDGGSVADAAAHADDETDPPSDLNATPEYRRHLARVLVGRALETVAGGGPR